jgi:2'-5' RNA ligase
MADDISTGKLRLFVAIPLPEAVRNAIVGVQEELRKLVSPKAVRWTQPEQFHLTLKFLGDVPGDRVTVLQEALAVACAGVGALALRAQSMGFFPNERSPRVIWAGISDDTGRLVDLQKRVESVVQPFTSGQGTERFAGHITLGRIKFLGRQEVGKLTAHAQTLTSRRFGEWTANEVELIQSELTPSGARHSVLAAIRLADKG